MGWPRKLGNSLSVTAGIVGAPGLYGDALMWRDIFRYLGVELGQVTAYLSWAPFILAAGILGFGITEGVPWVLKKMRACMAPQALSAEAQALLENCREALAKHIEVTGVNYYRSHILSSASTKLYPHMTDLCRVLDEQGIPHPEIEWDAISIVNTGRWSRFLGDLWAVRHDLERARRVYFCQTGYGCLQ